MCSQYPKGFSLGSQNLIFLEILVKEPLLVTEIIDVANHRFYFISVLGHDTHLQSLVIVSWYDHNIGESHLIRQTILIKFQQGLAILYFLNQENIWIDLIDY